MRYMCHSPRRDGRMRLRMRVNPHWPSDAGGLRVRGLAQTRRRLKNKLETEERSQIDNQADELATDSGGLI